MSDARPFHFTSEEAGLILGELMCNLKDCQCRQDALPEQQIWQETVDRAQRAYDVFWREVQK